MSSLRQVVRLAALLGAAWACPAGAGPLDLIESEGSAAELEVKDLPAPPEEIFLQPFALVRDARHRYLIDRRSLTVGADGIVRFTFVIRPQSGRLQSSYAGLQCNTAEWKTYAVLSTEGQWRKASAPAWRPIEFRQRDSARGDLYRHYLCADGLPSGTPEEMLKRLSKPIPQAHRGPPKSN